MQEKVCHVTHKSGLLTSSPWYTLYEKVFSVWIFPRDMFTFEAQHNVFWSYTLYFEIKILHFRGTTFFELAVYPKYERPYEPNVIA